MLLGASDEASRVAARLLHDGLRRDEVVDVLGRNFARFLQELD